MTDSRDPKDDPRSVQELVDIALGEADENTAWDAVCALHGRGSRDVLTVAQGLCQQQHPHKRRLGCDILGQIGVPERTFPEECVLTLLDVLREEVEATVLSSIFIAFSHLHDVRVIPMAAKFMKHPDADVRHAIVLALSGHDVDEAVAMLLKLTKDPSPLVRDWATFGLGTQSEADSPVIRDALAARLADVDAVTRGEALVGLANRGDSRAVAAIIEGDRPFVETNHFAEAKDILEEKGLV